MITNGLGAGRALDMSSLRFSVHFKEKPGKQPRKLSYIICLIPDRPQQWPCVHIHEGHQCSGRE